MEASLLVSLHALGAASQAELHLRQQGREMPSAEQLAATAAPLMQQSMAAAAPSGGKRAAAAPLEPDGKRQRAGESASGAGGGGGSHGSGMHLEKNAGASMPLTRLPAAQIAQLQQMLCMLAPEMVAELVISSMSHLPPRPKKAKQQSKCTRSMTRTLSGHYTLKHAVLYTTSSGVRNEVSALWKAKKPP